MTFKMTYTIEIDNETVMELYKTWANLMTALYGSNKSDISIERYFQVICDSDMIKETATFLETCGDLKTKTLKSISL